MWTRATLTTLVSMAPMTAPKRTAEVTSHLATAGSRPGARGAPPGPFSTATALPRVVAGVDPRDPVERDPDGDQLDHLDEVAGGVVGRQQRGGGAGGGADALHVPVEDAAPQRIDRDPDRVAHADRAQLRLLDVGHHPHVVGQREEQ